MKKSVCIALLLLTTGLFAQSPEDSLWHFMPTNQKEYSGINYDQARKVAEGKTANEIIVAVVDNGVDINHPDLEGRIWVNEDEIPNNGIDDDNNGYVDDIHGWNFLGSGDTSVIP